MATSPSVAVVEQCRVAPCGGAATAELSLPLTFYDTMWWNFPQLDFLLLYRFPLTRTHFVKTIIPQIKDSLSLALKHYLPLAGNLICPSNSGKLELQYVVGDSLSLTFAETSEDFDYFVQKGPRNANRFRHLVPQFPPTSTVSGTTRTPLFAVQVTLFPDYGLCIGWNCQHILGDGKSAADFFTAWASVNKFGGDAQLLASGSLPLFDRSVIEDPFDLESAIRNFLKAHRSEESIMLPTDNIRATYELSKDDIQNLKNFVLGNRPNHGRVTTFAVVCAYIWACRPKSFDASGEEVDENQTEIFNFPMDIRGRFDPPIPQTYFGNCVFPCSVTSKHGELAGPEGLLIAADLIREATTKWAHDKVGVLNGCWTTALAEQQLSSCKVQFGVAGSPRQDFYGVDFGWGKPERFENLSLDITGAMSLLASRELKGGVEVGLSMPKSRMDAFATIFTDGLQSIPVESKFDPFNIV